MASEKDNPFKKMGKKFKKARGEELHDMVSKHMKRKAVKHSGSFHGKSNALGQGGRAAQLKAQGVPGGVIGNLARAAQAAPGQKNFHKKKRKSSAPLKEQEEMALKRKKAKKRKDVGSKDMSFKRKDAGDKNAPEGDAKLKRKAKKR